MQKHAANSEAAHKTRGSPRGKNVGEQELVAGIKPSREKKGNNTSRKFPGVDSRPRARCATLFHGDKSPEEFSQS